MESALDKVYFVGYGPYEASLAGRPHRPRTRLPGRRGLLRRLDRFYTPEFETEQLVDYGSGAPTFLDHARERGFVTIGVDFADDVVKAVRSHGHAAFLADEWLDRVPDDSVGCVRLNHVIEHLYHPRKALTAIRRKMQPGGRIHIATPNPFSFGSRIFRRRWYALDCPRHVILYRPSVLSGLLHELGFDGLSVVQEVGSKDLTRSWGLVRYDTNLIRHEQIAEWGVNRARLGLLLPVAALAASIGAADRYHVFAQRT